MAAPTRQDRILVLAPHSDDETLACGGLIIQAVQAGAAVQVVYITNGDGFRLAAERVLSKQPVSPEDYRRLAAMRERESLAALAHLGVRANQAIFLGYPDRGTDQMWLHQWEPEEPYTSPYTKSDHNPYRDSLRPGGPYCGRALLDDLEAVISRFRPTLVVAPHPRDIHPDHWALYCYTAAALFELGLLERVKLRLYLVHRADRWRSPGGAWLDPSAPPAGPEEVGTRWETLPLSPEVAARKRQAILVYHTQLTVMKSFLLNFARGRELFGQVPIGHLPEVAPGRIRVDGRVEDWRDVPPMIVSPDRSAGALPRARVLRLYAAREGQRLLLRLDLAEAASRDVECRVHLHLLSQGKLGPPQNYTVRPGHSSPGVEFHAGGRSLEISLPVAGHTPLEGIMVGSETWRGSSRLDWTPWLVLKAGPVAALHGHPSYARLGAGSSRRLIRQPRGAAHLRSLLSHGYEP